MSPVPAVFAHRGHVLSRMPVNPLDKCTIVSVYHKPLRSIKNTIQPGVFFIPAAPSDDKFSLTVIGPSSWWKNMGEEEPPLEIVCSSVQVSDAIVNDYITALPRTGGGRRPGIFSILGEHTEKTVLGYKDNNGRTFMDLLAEARNQQKAYYQSLVLEADVLWSRSNGNPLAISDDARLAAEKLGLKDKKVWMGDFVAAELVNCKSCGTMANPLYPICPTCKNPIAGIK